MKGIPFTQFLRPDGRKRAVLIDRDAAIEADAVMVIKAGGRFEIEELQDGMISMTVECAAYETEDRGPVAIELCANGPAVPATVDKLVTAAKAALYIPDAP